MVTGSGFGALTHAQLAVVVRELLLCGHLIDRSGMPHLIGAFGREGMTEVAIEEWMAASPVYTKRMQRALDFEGDGVDTLFKGMQIEIGAPPQFMDFRYTVTDHDHGEFHLDHCGALMDVEPMGDEFVTAMCHDVEDPTFDATALATNSRAQVRPIHRPPRAPADRHPHCAWTVTIDERNESQPYPPRARILGESAAGTVALTDIDPSEPGRGHYRGPLLADVRFEDFSRSALVRIAEEICIQQHLLALGFQLAVRARCSESDALDIARKQLTGIAGLTSERLRDALGLADDLDALATVLSIHPVFNPRQYVDAEVVGGDRLTLRLGRRAGADSDAGWPSWITAEHLEPLAALVGGVNPRFDVRVVEDLPDSLITEVIVRDEPKPEPGEVALTRFSTGAGFSFSDRKSLPLTVV